MIKCRTFCLTKKKMNRLCETCSLVVSITKCHVKLCHTNVHGYHTVCCSCTGALFTCLFLCVSTDSDEDETAGGRSKFVLTLCIHTWLESSNTDPARDFCLFVCLSWVCLGVLFVYMFVSLFFYPVHPCSEWPC